jgi:hypothetical protein
VAADPAQYPFTLSGVTQVAWAVAAYRNAPSLSDASAGRLVTGTVSANDVTYLGDALVTTASADRLVLAFVDDSGSGTTFPETWTAPAGLTTAVEVGRAAIFDGTAAVVGSNGPFTAKIAVAGQTNAEGAICELAWKTQ